MNSIVIYYQNLRGLRTKTNEFFMGICNNTSDILIFSETWLIESIYDGELVDDRYMLFRRDRDAYATNKSMGGGVMIAVNKFLFPNVKINMDWQTKAEDLWITITHSGKKYHICCAYINSDINQLIVFEHYHKIDELVSRFPNDEFVILGDYNLPHLVTSNGILNGYNTFARKLINTINFCGLNQCSLVRNVNDRTLDLVLCSNNSAVIGLCFQ